MRIAVSLLAVVLFVATAPAQIGNIVVTSAATFDIGMPWAGSIATVFCTGLKGINGVVTANGYPLPFELAGVRVSVEGVSAPLFAVADLGGYQQVNFQVPWELTRTSGGGRVTVEQSGQQASALASPHAHGDFFRLPDGSGAFQHADYSLVSAANPARAGEVIIGYMTGLLVTTTPAVATGQPAPANPPAVVANPTLMPGWPLFQIGVGGVGAAKLVTPLFLGLAPGLAGVYQVNFTVPDGLTAGNQPVELIENYCVSVVFDPKCYGIVPGGRGVSLPVPMAIR